MFLHLKKSQVVIIIGIMVIGLVALGLALGLLLTKDQTDAARDSEKISYRGAVVTNGYECAKIGRDILDKGGSAVDAAIASGLCEGIGMPQSTGLGGGFLMTVYIKETGTVKTINAREVAPKGASQGMFDDQPELSSTGGLAVAVPGELRGYQMAHREFGKLDWKELVLPTVELCRLGNLVTPYLANLFESRKETLKNEPSLSEVFIDPNTGEPWKEGQRVVRNKLADTLELVAEHGADVLYDGILTETFVNDVNAFGGIFTLEDMRDYQPVLAEAVSANLPFGQKLHTVPLPGSGLILAYIFNILKHFLDTNELNTVTNWQRIVESFKFGYGLRTQMGDPDYVEGIDELIANMTSEAYANATRYLIFDEETFTDPAYYGANFSLVEDHGTAHWAILAPNGDAVSVTGTINLIFGSKRRSRSTGIILNDEMDDFSSNFVNSFGVPPSPANFIKPGKRPLSSMTPTIIVDQSGDARLVIGAAGGTKITTSVALIAIENLWFGQSLLDALSGKRLHHQLFPMEISYESDFNQTMIDGLKRIGHAAIITDAKDGFAAATAISNSNGKIEAVWDRRRTGSIELIP